MGPTLCQITYWKFVTEEDMLYCKAFSAVIYGRDEEALIVYVFKVLFRTLGYSQSYSILPDKIIN